jgi:hypothetical protein
LLHVPALRSGLRFPYVVGDGQQGVEVVHVGEAEAGPTLHWCGGHGPPPFLPFWLKTSRWKQEERGSLSAVAPYHKSDLCARI